MKTKILSLALLSALAFTSCNDNENLNVQVEQPVEVQPTTFRLKLRNAINYLNVKKIGDAPLTQTGQTFTVDFKATQGTYLSFANMFAQSNDWFFGTDSRGIKLWEGSTPTTGDITSKIGVYDAGTEQDEDFLNNFPSTIYTAPRQAAPNSGPADSNNLVRNTGRNIRNYETASLSYNESTKMFTLTITKANREAAHNPGFVTPGILVVHTLDNALYEVGAPVKANGFEGLAEDGSPAAIYNWFTEEGTAGAPLRLSSSWSVLSPALAYVHQGDQSPLFTNNAPIMSDNGLEELAEDGSNDKAFTYLNAMENVTAYKGDEPITPGKEVTFEIQARPGDKLNFATMLISSNDWFISNNQKGIALFDENGEPKTEFVVNKNYLYDSGTEIDQIVGLGNGQPMRGNVTVADDNNTNVRRVTSLEDVQFGKGVISSAAGVTQHREVRGGYNLIEVTIEKVN
ncbi:spondin domain-containing protein [uncultured Polaribacter sp.]|uniref:spondin domain-containing protein n=1 Tax=uncultured Polaribacter sp. TaxID=174711 RepID=UPI002601B6F8|nr:spondin domain-containing protein [uncultured Polaribacter sp.]